MKRTVGKEEGMAGHKEELSIWKTIPFTHQELVIWFPTWSQENITFKEVCPNLKFVHPSPLRKTIERWNFMSFTIIYLIYKSIILIIEFIDKHESKKQMKQDQQSRGWKKPGPLISLNPGTGTLKTPCNLLKKKMLELVPPRLLIIYLKKKMYLYCKSLVVTYPATCIQRNLEAHWRTCLNLLK